MRFPTFLRDGLRGNARRASQTPRLPSLEGGQGCAPSQSRVAPPGAPYPESNIARTAAGPSSVDRVKSGHVIACLAVTPSTPWGTRRWRDERIARPMAHFTTRGSRRVSASSRSLSIFSALRRWRQPSRRSPRTAVALLSVTHRVPLPVDSTNYALGAFGQSFTRRAGEGASRANHHLLVARGLGARPLGEAPRRTAPSLRFGATAVATVGLTPSKALRTTLARAEGRVDMS